jgi:transposase
MDTLGLDLHKRESQLCIIGSQGGITEKRIMTTRERFTAVLLGRARCRILLEASTESEWVARHLESQGHEVIVADPGFAPMYATRCKKVKTDKRDARTLAEACVLGAYRATHRVSTEHTSLSAIGVKPITGAASKVPYRSEACGRYQHWSWFVSLTPELASRRTGARREVLH